MGKTKSKRASGIERDYFVPHGSGRQSSTRPGMAGDAGIIKVIEL